jgi:hypothetical protein
MREESLTQASELDGDGVCGTYGGYQRHRRRGEQACTECRRANRDYTRTLRQRPGVREEENARTAARSRALWRLADEQRERFRELFIEEVTRERP